MIRLNTFIKAMTKKSIFCLFISIVCIPSTLLAQTYPTKPLTVVVPTATGGANDTMARLVAQGLSQKLGQAVVVENKPGGSGAIACEYVARSNPDGYTILFGYIATHAMNPALKKLRYDPVKDFEPIGMIAVSRTLLVVNGDLPVQTTKDLIAYLKTKPDTLGYGSSGRGTAPHLTGELFQINTGTKMVHVPYKGSSPAIFDVMAGNIQIMFPSVFTAMPHIRTGKLKPLGVADDKRLSVLPNLPTLSEQGIPNMNVTQWYALFAPAKTPASIINLLNKEMNSFLQEDAMKKKFEDQGSEVETGTPAQLKETVQSEMVRWKKLIDTAHITAD
jgi:tripartite-type tricarboxylate transporter receptor subunit TctC